MHVKEPLVFPENIKNCQAVLRAQVSVPLRATKGMSYQCSWAGMRTVLASLRNCYVLSFLSPHDPVTESSGSLRSLRDLPSTYWGPCRVVCAMGPCLPGS